MYFTGFFVSFYLHKITSSDLRATVLSFKGLAYNISYGVLGVFYALVLKAEKEGFSSPEMENAIFMDTFSWFPITFGAWFLIVLGIYFLWLKNRT
jgi:hypothetical protein